MHQAPPRATTPTPSTLFHSSSAALSGQRASGAGLSRGFGPRPGPGARRRALADGGGAPQLAAATAGRPPHLRILCQTGQQQQAAVAREGDGGVGSSEQPVAPAAPSPDTAALERSGDGDGDMNGQGPFRQQGLPSSRSDTMLLQSAEAQWFGRSASDRGGVPPRRWRVPRVAAPANGVAAAGAAAGTAAGAAGANNSIPVFVMLPLDTVSAACGTVGGEG